MTPSTNQGLTVLQGLLAAGCVALLLADAQQPAAPPELVLQPVAPPLTRIAALGDAPLLPEPSGGGPAPPPDHDPHRHQAAPPHPPGPAQGGSDLGHVLRLQVEADAIAMVELLGPERVAAAVAHRESLSALLGETRTWDELLEILEARSAEALP